MLDIAVLRLAKHRKEYLRIKRAFRPETSDPKTVTIFNAFGKYFEKFPTHESVDFSVFVPRFQQWNPKMDVEVLGVYNTMFKALHKDVDDDTRVGIVQELYQVDTATKMANILSEFHEGTLMADLIPALNQVMDNYKKSIEHRDVPWITTSIEDLLQEDLDNSGIKFRLKVLREHMRPLRPGDALIIAGRPDRGKTTWFSSEVSYLAPQLPEDQNAIWMNNEGPGGRVVKRLYQSALGLTIPEMVEMGGKRIREEYERLVGRVDRIRVVDMHYSTVDQVEQIVEASNAGLVVFDMIDKIKGFSGASRTDERLEEMYDWARSLAAKQGFISLAASQISADGEGMCYPSMDMLKDSRTGKQGACDAIIMIGAKNEKGFESARYIGVPKNKLHIAGMPKDPQQEVAFDASRGRYNDIVIHYEDATQEETENALGNH